MLTQVSYTAKYFMNALAKSNFDVGQKLAYFLATGNLVSPTGLDLQQTTGYTIVAEKLNYYRYLSHFRCIHRGAFFAELKTTTVRKLLPEAWGELRIGLPWPRMTAEADIVTGDLRILVSRAYTRRFALWSLEPLVAFLQDHHRDTQRRPSAGSLIRSGYDAGVCFKY